MVFKFSRGRCYSFVVVVYISAVVIQVFWSGRSVVDSTCRVDAAMGIILPAAGSTAGWTTGSGLEGPAYSMKNAASEMPGPILSKSPRRRMCVAFTCNVWGHRSI